MLVSSKKMMYAMLYEGKFGNTARIWRTYQELLASDYRGMLGIRSLTPGGQFLAHVPFDLAPCTDAIYSEMQEDARILLQGEVYRSVDGLYLYASKLKNHMRIALRDGGQHYWRLAAILQLQDALYSSDYEALMQLLDAYTDSVVEFSAYDTFVGNIPYRNTIIWEVRNY